MEYIKKHGNLSFKTERATDLSQDPDKLSIVQTSLVSAVSRYKIGKIPYDKVMEAIKNYRNYIEQIKLATGGQAQGYKTIAELICEGSLSFCAYTETQEEGVEVNTRSEGGAYL